MKENPFKKGLLNCCPRTRDRSQQTLLPPYYVRLPTHNEQNYVTTEQQAVGYNVTLPPVGREYKSLYSISRAMINASIRILSSAPLRRHF